MKPQTKAQHRRALRFPPSPEDTSGVIDVEFEVVNESFSGALLKLQLKRTDPVTVIPNDRAPYPARIARVEFDADGNLLLGITWDGTGDPLA